MKKGRLSAVAEDSKKKKERSSSTGEDKKINRKYFPPRGKNKKKAHRSEKYACWLRIRASCSHNPQGDDRPNILIPNSHREKSEKFRLEHKDTNPRCFH